MKRCTTSFWPTMLCVGALATHTHLHTHSRTHTHTHTHRHTHAHTPSNVSVVHLLLPVWCTTHTHAHALVHTHTRTICWVNISLQLNALEWRHQRPHWWLLKHPWFMEFPPSYRLQYYFPLIIARRWLTYLYVLLSVPPHDLFLFTRRGILAHFLWLPAFTR